MRRVLVGMCRDAAAGDATGRRVAATPRAETACTIGSAIVAVGVGLRTGGAVPLIGAAVLAAMALTATRVRRGTRLLAGQLTLFAAGTSVLVVTNAGLGHITGQAASTWQPLLAMAAYPFLGRSVLRLLDRYRRIREADVMVEGALVGAAVGIVLQVAFGDLHAPAAASVWANASGALPAALIGLDVAVLVVAVRGLTASAARRGPLVPIIVGLTCLLSAHTVQALTTARGIASGWSAEVVAAIGLLCFAGAALHPRASAEPDRLPGEAPLFSASHATIVVLALLAAPGVLAVQALRNLTASATVATGAVLSGAVLACYLVGLLQERAATEHQATHDALTGLPNRMLFTDRLERAIAHARRNHLPVGVLFIDLDRFKEVNDTFGHAAGDLLLRTVAHRLLRCRRDEDTVARLSGDEFAVLLPHLAAPGDVVVVVQRVLAALGEPVSIAGQRMLITGSIGVAVYPDDGGSAEEILASADAAMYRAKETAGNSYEIFSASLSTQAHERLHLEAALYAGLERDELELHFQPIVDLATGRTAGAEALVRWMHPDKGMLLPGHFIPVAEQSDLIVHLGDRVIHEACAQLRRWADLGLRDLSVSVNVSSRHFSRGLVSSVTAALRASGADPRNLVIELTESTAVDNLDAVAATLEELRDLGVRSAIDDFGTGYCGLRYLSTLPVDCLKIDQSFIQGMTPSAAAIVAATIAMGHSLGLTLIAEGVETIEQERFLVAQRCDGVQGYLLGRPMPARDLTDRVRAERAHDASVAALSAPGRAAEPIGWPLHVRPTETDGQPCPAPAVEQCSPTGTG